MCLLCELDGAAPDKMLFDRSDGDAKMDSDSNEANDSCWSLEHEGCRLEEGRSLPTLLSGGFDSILANKFCDDTCLRVLELSLAVTDNLSRIHSIYSIRIAQLCMQ